MAAPVSSSQRIQTSLLKLASTKSHTDIDLDMIAKDADVSVEEMTSLYSSRQDIVWEIIARLNAEALSTQEFSSDDSLHDKLFDLLMKRFEALQEHKDVLRNLMSPIKGSDVRSLYVNTALVRSMGWILDAAGAGTSGLDGEARKRGLAWVFGSALEVFLEEDDPGLPKTMMVLDRGLSKTVVWQERLGGAANILKGAGSLIGAFLDNLQKKSKEREEPSTEQSEPLEKD